MDANKQKTDNTVLGSREAKKNCTEQREIPEPYVGGTCRGDERETEHGPAEGR